MKNFLLLGSTGSIGTQALEIIRNNKDKFKAVGLSCRSRVDDLIDQIREFRPEAVCVGNGEDAKRIDEFVKSESLDVDVFCGDEGLVKLAAIDCDIVLNALMGISGLAPTYEAVSLGKDIALANKETLVAGGKLITDLCREKGVRLLPIDSEHSAIFQCLEGNGGSACGRAFCDIIENSHNLGHKEKGIRLNFESDKNIVHDEKSEIPSPIRRILLTASGGPFRGRTLEELRDVTIEQALNHPKWSMGSKITIDSATMMNKGLEVIEARWLFDVPAEKIDIHVHPESLVHSMVEFCDGSVMAQMGMPDMKIPIAYAMNYPGRIEMMPEFKTGSDVYELLPDYIAASGSSESVQDAVIASAGMNVRSLDFFTTGSKLTFERPDREVFRCIDLAYSAIIEGGSAPVVMNGANEELVAMFLAGEIGFLDIQETIEEVMNMTAHSEPGSVEEILAIDREARVRAREIAAGLR